MMHAFPRTFSLATSRADPVAAPAFALAPLTPAAYLRLCREAAGMTRSTVAVMLAPRPGHLAQASDLLDMLETPGNVARKPETLERLRAIFPFDPDVDRQRAGRAASPRLSRLRRQCLERAGGGRPATLGDEARLHPLRRHGRRRRCGMIAGSTSRAPRLRRAAVMALTVVGAIVAVPFMLIFLIVRIGGEK